MKSKIILDGVIALLVLSAFSPMQGKNWKKFGSLQIPTLKIPASAMNKQPSKALDKIVNLHIWSSSTSPTNDTSSVTELAYDGNHALSGAYAYKFDNTTYARISDVRTSYSNFLPVDPSKGDMVSSNNSMYSGLLDSFQKNTLPGTQGSLNYYNPQKIKTQYMVNGSWVDSAELDIHYTNKNTLDTFTSWAYINGTWKIASAGKFMYDNNGNQTVAYIVTMNSSNQALYTGYPGIESESIELTYDKNKRVIGSSIKFHYDGSGFSFNPSDLLPIYHESYYYDGNGKLNSASRKVSDASSWSMFSFGSSSDINDSFSSLSYINFKSNVLSLDNMAILHYGGSRFKGYTHWTFDVNQNKYVQSDRFTASMNTGGSYYTELKETYNSSKFVNSGQNQIFTNSNGTYKYNMISSYDASGVVSNKEAYKWTLALNSSGDITDWLETDSTLDLGFGGYNFYHPVKYIYNSFTTGIENKTNANDINISVYPNPAENSINIHGLEAKDKLSILDITGKVIFNDIISFPDNYSLDLTKMKSGVYFIRAIGDKGVQGLRFVKQ